MVTIESFCEHGSAEGTTQPGIDQQRALNKAMRRAAKARHELDAAIYRAAAFESTNISSSRESDNEEANHEKYRHAGRHQHMPGPHPYHHAPRSGHFGSHGPHHHPTHPMTGRHLRGFGKFPGMMRHERGQHAHRPPHAHLHPHPHHYHHHHHYLGHSISAHGRPHAHGVRHRHSVGHGHTNGSAATAFERSFQQCRIGHASGPGGRAHSCPVV